MNIALISPAKNAYSETFIQAHKEFLNGTIFFYYGGETPLHLEGGLLINSRRSRIIDILKGHFNLNRYSLAEQALLKSFRKNNIQVVLAEYGPSGEKIAPICKELGIPLIVHFHGYDGSVKTVLNQYHNYKNIFDLATFIVAVSKKMYQDLVEMGCPEDKLKYNVYGPSDDFLKVVPNFSKQQFIGVGRFVNKKAPYYLLLSFLKVLEKFPQARLIMAGNGDLLNTCKNLTRYYEIEENVEFPGVINPEKYRDYLKESLAFVQHSLVAENGDSEGTPVSILEASAAGLPVISTRHAGIPDVIIDGETGLLVEEHDVEGMAANMINLLENIEFAKELGLNGKKNIAENFSLNRHIGVLNDLLAYAFQNNL